MRLINITKDHLLVDIQVKRNTDNWYYFVQVAIVVLVLNLHKKLKICFYEQLNVKCQLFYSYVSFFMYFH